jgi:hypothetical protein
MYMDRWYSTKTIFNHVWACKTQGVGTVMSKRKEMHKQAFSGKLKKGGWEYYPNELTSWLSNGRTSRMFFS